MASSNLFQRFDPILLLLWGGFASALAKPLTAWFLGTGTLPSLTCAVCCAYGIALLTPRLLKADGLRHASALVLALLPLVLLPYAMLSWVALAILGAYIAWHAPSRSMLRAAAIIIVLSSLRMPGTELVMSLFAESLLSFDGWLANGIGGVLGVDTQFRDNIIMAEEGHSVFVMSGCASFANISDGLLIWATCALAFGANRSRILVPVGITLAAAIFLVNAVRLGLMTISRDLYTFLHDGMGTLAVEFSLYILIAICCFITLRMAREGRGASHA